MLVVADPALSGARSETAALARIYPRAIILSGDSATAARFAREAPQFRLIHFAGHGLAGSPDTLPALVFTPDSIGRDRIWSSDIARLDLRRAGLVVLAGCDTFRGDTAPVEGMPSMARAFLQAGVPAVIGTLWQIDDQRAAKFFSRFYGRLRSGLSPAAALHGAQLDELTRGEVSGWAAFEIIGTTREDAGPVRLSQQARR
jgi:CHAT domain-containing protein